MYAELFIDHKILEKPAKNSLIERFNGSYRRGIIDA